MKSGNSTAQIKCTSDSSMYFYQSQSILITNLEFIGYGGNQVRHVEEFVVEDAKFKGQENSGTALELIETTAQIVNSTFLSNRNGLYSKCGCLFDGFIGGAIIATNSTVEINQSRFEDNGADFGGAIFAELDSIINMSGNQFVSNNAIIWGGVLYSNSSTITIEASKFQDNNARWGGALDSTSSNITIEESEFQDNSADIGGVLFSISSTITIEASGFHGNNATDSGGVLESSNDTITIAGSNFTNNISPIGAIIHTFRSMIQHIHSYLLVDNNKADRYAVIYLSDSKFFGDDSGNVTFSNNLGSLVTFNSNITFTGYATFVNNTLSQTVSGDFQEGGAITLFQSNIFFYGECNLEHNHAENGGAMHSTDSKLYVNGDVTIAHNTATGNGGGVYLSTSELNCQQESTFVLLNNIASHKGGGLHAISSSIKAVSFNTGYPQYVYTGTRINITGNAAERGGGLSLEANTKFYILKYDYHYNDDDNDLINTTTFAANSADYGGAMYVDDDTNSGTCAGSTETECFFQVLTLYGLGLYPHHRIQSMHFSQNHANISGSTLYGGLLDRCAVSPFAEVHNKYPHDFKHRGDGFAYFKNVSTFTYYYNPYYYDYYYDTSLREIISSDPVRVCFASMLIKTMTAPTNITLRVKRDKHSHSQLLLLIRMANQLVQPSKPPSTSLRVV